MSKASISTPSPQVLLPRRLFVSNLPPVQKHSGFCTLIRAAIRSIPLTAALQGKLKRVQDHDIDLEAGSSKKKLVLSDPGPQYLESQAQPESQQAGGEKPSFRVIGHFVMAMKRFQGEQKTLQALVSIILP